MPGQAEQDTENQTFRAVHEKAIDHYLELMLKRWES
jgi:hypothetical protein